MPHVVVWSPHSIASIQRLYRFLAAQDIDVAKAAAQRILQQAKVLESFPHAGRPAEDLEPEHRELLIPFGGAGYVLLYYFAENSNTLTILAIRHQKEIAY